MDENIRKVYLSEELLQRIEAVANRSQVSKGQAIAMALDLLEKLEAADSKGEEFMVVKKKA